MRHVEATAGGGACERGADIVTLALRQELSVTVTLKDGRSGDRDTCYGHGDAVQGALVAAPRESFQMVLTGGAAGVLFFSVQCFCL